MHRLYGAKHLTIMHRKRKKEKTTCRNPLPVISLYTN